MIHSRCCYSGEEHKTIPSEQVHRLYRDANQFALVGTHVHVHTHIPFVSIIHVCVCVLKVMTSKRFRIVEMFRY